MEISSVKPTAVGKGKNFFFNFLAELCHSKTFGEKIKSIFGLFFTKISKMPEGEGRGGH